ncbi:ferrous iron transport protein A [Thiocapsa roseopersicina]|uniref:Ferrous iron transport protein A n=2 Tax=Thiocapsa roseopersicina TaxID=1058 RepID=A0A1H2TWV0_THIRO|nr:ferrous iron transport protein A [Thiocapsa roseopersicina]
MFGQHGLSNPVRHEPLMMGVPTVKGFPLMMADEGARVRIVALHGGKGLTTRLTELGLNVGSELAVVQRQGGGLLIARGEARIALGGGMAAKIQVVPLA